MKMHKGSIVKLDQLDHAYNEMYILSRNRNPFCIELKAVFQDENNVFLLTEYLPGKYYMSLHFYCIYIYISLLKRW